jgi:hypothetical protein
VFNGSQILKEFIEAWNQLIPVIEKTQSISFLEVGAFGGVWALMLSHVCEPLNIPFTYTTVTWIKSDYNGNSPLFKVKSYYENKNYNFNLIDSNSQDPKTKDFLESNYDIVFIDADHRYERVMKDISLYSSLATKVLLFHDIRPIISTSDIAVYKALQDSNIILDKEIVTNPSTMGIGLKFIK